MIEGNLPNILFITTDQQRWDTFGCYGNASIQTPNLDRLAEDGMRFERAYCESPICIPSRISLITGKKASHHGATLHNSNMRNDERTLADELANHGYQTHFVGKAHFKSQEQRGTEESLPDWRDGKFAGWRGPYAGFQTLDLVLGHSNSLLGHYGEWLRTEHAGHSSDFMLENMQPLEVSCGQGVYRNTIPTELHSSAFVGRRTVEFLTRAAQKAAPFFCWASFPDPHWPICPPSPFYEMYDQVQIPENTAFPSDLSNYPRQFHQLRAGKRTGYDGGGHLVTDPEDIPKITRPYWGSISFIDRQVGIILDQLDQLGLAKNTLVLFTSDHGEHMGAHGLMAKGGFPYEEFIRCPLIMRYQQRIPAGVSSHALFSFIDVVPTLLDMLSIQNHHLAPDGVIQTPVLSNPEEIVRERLTVTHFGQTFTHGEKNMPLRSPDIHSLITREWKLNYYAGDANGELYNLGEDPQEANNLYNQPAYQDMQNDLTRQLMDELILVNDREPQLQRNLVEPGYAEHRMKYDFWKTEFDQLAEQS